MMKISHMHVLINFFTSNKNFTLILDVGMEKEQKKELGWRVSLLPIPAFHCILCTYSVPTQ